MQVVMVRLLGGLANQIFQYAMGRAVAIRNGALLRFDTQDLDADTLRSFALQPFNIRGEKASLMELDFFRQSGDQDRFAFIGERVFEYDPEMALARAPAYLQGYWQTDKYFSEIDAVLRRDLTLKGGLSREGAALAEEMGGRLSVSIHVRRGDYVANAHTNSFHGVVSRAYLNAAMETMIDRRPGAAFYVFTDDPDWARKNLSAAAEIIFVSDRVSVSDAEELVLMGRCRHHILSNSSYSWWGAWLNPNRQKTVIAPTPWFRSANNDTKDLYGADWIRLPID